MASPAVKLTFVDGRTEEVRLNPRVLIEVERKFGEIPPLEGTLYGAWHRLGRPGDFESFIDSVEGMENVENGVGRPTEPEASDGS